MFADKRHCSSNYTAKNKQDLVLQDTSLKVSNNVHEIWCLWTLSFSPSVFPFIVIVAAMLITELLFISKCSIKSTTHQGL